jgi:hypothetical protein
MIKKVQTEQVVVTPSPNTRIKLSELNKILDEMQQGEKAVERLRELDNSRGLQDPVDVARRLRGDKLEAENAQRQPVQPIPGADGVLGDSFLANNLLQQAQRMEAEAKGLLAESARLQKEANDMLGIPTATQATIQAPVKRGRGRPAKAKVTV